MMGYLSGVLQSILAISVMLFMLAPIRVDAAPTLNIYTDTDTYIAGDTIEVSLAASNYDEPITVDVYVGLLTRDGTIFTFGQAGLSDSIEPWIRDVYLSSGFDIGPIPILSLDVPAGIEGDFQLCAGLTSPGTLEFLSEISFAPFMIESGNTAPTAHIDIILPNPALQGQDTVEFMGHGIDADGTIEAHVWASDLDGAISTLEDFSIEAADLSVGTHTISYRVQDNDGAWSDPDTEALIVGEAERALYVSAIAGSDSNDGSEEHPFQTITHALALATGSEANPLTIYVAAGRYAENSNGETFPLSMKSWVSLSSEDRDITILDAEGAAYHVIYCDGVNDLTIEGFTITGGDADGSGVLEHYGGGILCSESSPNIFNNLITGNAASCGGALSCYNASSPMISGNTMSENVSSSGGAVSCHDGSSPVISGNTIIGNSASMGSGIYSCNISSPMITSNTISDNIGTGIYCAAETTVTDNIISGNDATGLGGGAIRCEAWASPDGMPMIRGNDIYDSSASYGGGIYCSLGSPTIKENVITNNSSTYAVDGHGGGIYLWRADALVSNNIVVSNSSAVAAGGIYCGECAPTIFFNTIVSNQAAQHGGGISCWDSSPVIKDCIVWDNGDDLYGCSAAFCCIEDSDAGKMNIHDNPRFAEGPYGEFYLEPESPCINAGSRSASEARLDKFTTQGSGDPDTGTVDMGYHYPIPPRR